MTTRLTLTAIALSLSACAEPGAIDGTYIARLGDTLIAVVVADPDGLAVAYACDGRDGADPTVYAWFAGTLEAGAAELAGQAGTLTVVVDAEAATGELRLNDTDAQPFDAARSAAGALLWGSLPPGEGDLLGGWIFADDGTQRGAVLKRNTGDVAALTLPSLTAATTTFEGLTLSIRTMTAPTLVQ